MIISGTLYRIASAIVVAGALTACGALETSTPPKESAIYPPLPSRPSGPRQSGWLSPEVKAHHQRLLYVSSVSSWDVEIFPEKGLYESPIGTITSGVYAPWGIYVDGRGTLYVANSANGTGQGTVTIYPLGATVPSLTLSQDLRRPLYVIADHAGNVYVANGGNVVEYLAGKTDVFQVRKTPGNEADGMAFDRQGNLYVAWRNGYYVGGIEKFPPNSLTGVRLGMSLNQPQGLVVDDSGNIVVVETGYTNRIDLFPPGSSTPSLEIPGVNDGLGELAITKKEKRLFSGSGLVLVYSTSYPLSSSSSLYPKDAVDGGAFGVALSNGQ